MSYTVITHDGRMPRDGGIRLGFVAGGKVFALPGVSLHWLVQTTPPAPLVPKKMTIFECWELPQCRSFRNGCALCGSPRTESVTEILADDRPKQLIKCKACGKLMRDFYDD